MRIPESGLQRDDILNSLTSFKANDPDWRGGKVFAYVFKAGDDVMEIAEEALRGYMWDNGLDPRTFKSLHKLETEIVAMSATHLRGDPAVVTGNFTSGGTESVLLAMKTARDFARSKGIAEPEMVVPITAHACFHKAAHYFDMPLRVVPVDGETFKVDPAEMEKAINENTAVIVGSAPSYAHGVVDPIPELGQLALKHDVLLHVDGCIGAFMLPLYRAIGADVPEFDFTVPGVTSISMDFHKYGFAPKGASVVLYKNKELRRHQIYACSGWTGYTIINATIQSTKSGGPMAGTWAVMNYLGMAGYKKIAQGLKDATDAYIAGVQKIDGLKILGDPDICLVAVGADSEDVDIFKLCDAMHKRGWHLGPQPAIDNIPPSFHITMLPPNTPIIEQLLSDLAECVEEVRGQPQNPMVEQVAAMAQGIDPDTLTDEMIQNLLGMVGMAGEDAEAPDEDGDVNAILSRIPPKLADRILTTFFNEWLRWKK